MPLALPVQAQSADVFASGKQGYHTFRIPAIEVARDGTLLAFAEARTYSGSDPGFGKQDTRFNREFLELK